MELLGRVMNLMSRVINNNIFIDACLVGSFAALGLRSMNQEKLIEALEAENETLTLTNKSMKKTIWDSKQQLYAQASSPDTAIVPLSTLKAIYGDVVSTRSGFEMGMIQILCFYTRQTGHLDGVQFLQLETRRKRGNRHQLSLLSEVIAVALASSEVQGPNSYRRVFHHTGQWAWFIIHGALCLAGHKHDLREIYISDQEITN